jgi:proteasome lid subunit RPN8/RPN11
MEQLSITKRTLQAMEAHALSAYPEECCGTILEHEGQEVVHRILNVQNSLHQKNPEEYPRDARTAYYMEPRELLAALKEVEEGKKLKAFYHSHPEHDAYFSEEDKTRAMAWNEPTYPDSAYVVISVYNRVVKEVCAYAWDAEKRDFLEIPLKII